MVIGLLAIITWITATCSCLPRKPPALSASPSRPRVLFRTACGCARTSLWRSSRVSSCIVLLRSICGRIRKNGTLDTVCGLHMRSTPCASTLSVASTSSGSASRNSTMPSGSGNSRPKSTTSRNRMHSSQRNSGREGRAKNSSRATVRSAVMVS